MVTIYALTATSSVFALKGCPLLQGRKGMMHRNLFGFLCFGSVAFQGVPLYSVHRCRWILLRS